MLWIIFAAMTAAALALILVPLWREGGTTADRSAYDIEVYRDQLEELDYDLERGLIDGDDADAARAEISRRLLTADAAVQRDGELTSATQRRAWIAGGLAFAIPAMAAITYGFLGAPGLPGNPAAERHAAPTLDPAPGPSAEDVEAASRMSIDDRQEMIRSMVARLAERLAETPDDADGWIRLGRSYRVLGEAAKSRAAYAKAAVLRPDNVSVLSGYIASIANAAGADATEQPEFIDTIAKILGLDPDNYTALWFSGLRAKKLGDGATAARHWRNLLALLDAGSDEHTELSRRLGELEAGR